MNIPVNNFEVGRGNSAQPLQTPGTGNNREQLPPSRAMLLTAGCKAVTHSTPVAFLGSHTMKAVGGAMMGFGAVGCIAGGVGLPLVVAGAIVYGLSLLISTCNLQQYNLKSISMHLAASVISGAVGVGLGFIGLITAAGPVGGAAKIVISAGAITVGPVPLLMDQANVQEASYLAHHPREGNVAVVLS